MRVASLALLLVLAGCTTLAPRESDTLAPTITTADDLVNYLGQRGVILRPDRLASSRFLDAVGQQYRIDGGGTLQVFEFDDANAAESGVDDYVQATEGGQQVRLFQRGRLLAAYYGGATSVVSVLADALGPAAY